MNTGMGIRTQVSLAIMTGVLVIVITTIVVVIMGQPKSNVDDFGASDPLPSLALLGTPTPIPTPKATTAPSAEASPSKKKLVLACGTPKLTLGNNTYCTVSITPAATSTLTVTLHASTADIALPGGTTIMRGASFSDPFLINGQASSGGSTTLTAKAIGLTATFSVSVTAG